MDIQELHNSYYQNLRSLSDDVFSFKNAIDLKSLKVLFLYRLLQLSAFIKVKRFGLAITSILAPSATFSYFKKQHLLYYEDVASTLVASQPPKSKSNKSERL
ncbi:hypothetical protein CXB51_009673 [Gossypium anomalum]|uniref:Uncharacterized protein n=1 Tax=Gossypium anomalum TaxID=47600 RepID=A0A8J5YZT4_9ROSI|nr:hypothetical protein CXB51_009673 [Gossypium anomalum]